MTDPRPLPKRAVPDDLVDVTIADSLFGEPNYFCEILNSACLVSERDGRVLGFRVRMEDGSEMMIPLVAIARDV